MALKNCLIKNSSLWAILCCHLFSYSQKTIAGFLADLSNTTSVTKKADLCFEVADLYINKLKIDSALYYADKTKEYSQQANYETGIGKYYLATGRALYFRRRNNETEENVNKAIEIFTRRNEVIFLGRAYLVLGTNYYVAEKLVTAREYFWKAIHCFETFKDIKGLYATYRWIALSYYKTSETDSASFYNIQALSAAEQLGDSKRIFETASWLGSNFLSQNEPSKAVKYFEYGLKNTYPEIDKVGYMMFLTEYATSLVLIHSYTDVDSVLKKIEAVNGNLKDPFGLISINKIKGTLAYEKGNFRQALFFLNNAYNKSMEQNTDPDQIQAILILLGKSEYEMHQYDSSVFYLKKVVIGSRENNESLNEEEASLCLSEAFQQQGNIDSALYYFKHYTVLKDSISSQQKQKTIFEISTRYETEKKEQLIKILEKEKEANAYYLLLKNQQLEKQQLNDEKKSQQLQLLSQQADISRLEASQKTLALQNQKRDMLKKQKELEFVSRESQFRASLAKKEKQQKQLAFVAAFIVLIFGAISFYRYRQNRKLGKQLSASLVALKRAQKQLIKTEKEKEAENVRIGISRDIHDEVGATLSGVALFSEIAKEKMELQQKDEVHMYLNYISDNSKEMVEKMSDIVWAINPDNDSFERIFSKLEIYAFNLCAGKGMSFHMQIDNDLRDRLPSMHVKRNLYLFLKEGINNAVKYSEAKNIFLSMRSETDQLIVLLKDDGKGFDASLNYPGNGLKNLKTRAEGLDAVFFIQSQVGKGTSISISFHFHPAGGQMTAG